MEDDLDGEKSQSNDQKTEEQKEGLQDKSLDSIAMRTNTFQQEDGNEGSIDMMRVMGEGSQEGSMHGFESAPQLSEQDQVEVKGADCDGLMIENPELNDKAQMSNERSMDSQNDHDQTVNIQEQTTNGNFQITNQPESTLQGEAFRSHENLEISNDENAMNNLMKGGNFNFHNNPQNYLEGLGGSNPDSVVGSDEIGDRTVLMN